MIGQRRYVVVRVRTAVTRVAADVAEETTSSNIQYCTGKFCVRMTGSAAPSFESGSPGIVAESLPECRRAVFRRPTGHRCPLVYPAPNAWEVALQQ